MKREFIIVQGDPDELSPYSKDNLIELECSCDVDTKDTVKKEALEKEMAEILRDVIKMETGVEKVKYPIKLFLVDEFTTERLIPRSEDELKELAEEREVGSTGDGPYPYRSEANDTRPELGA